jgi:hypothetical protein
LGVIPAAFGVLSANYPPRPNAGNYDPDKYECVKKVMATLPSTATPCCVQMSRALNMAGIQLPAASYRPPRDSGNPQMTINGNDYFCILATDELEKFLYDLTGDDGESINKDLGSTRSMDDIKTYIANRPGLLIFRYSNFCVPGPPGQFEHTELWDGTQILQRDMNEAFLFARPRVLMWDTNDPARWLVNYMSSQP